MSHHLDNLLYFLENPEELSDGDNNDAAEGCGGGGHLDETIEPPEEMETQLNETQSSNPRTRRSVVNLYRRSSSASQHILKNNHCYFCNLEPNQSNFENHLRGSQRCLSLYERKLKIKGIEGVLLLLFPCLFCCYNGTSRLQFHLERNPSCRDKYFQRWGVDIDDGADASQLNRGIRVVTAKVRALKRPAIKSRGADARTEQYKTSRMAKQEMKSIENCLNEFKMKTALGNYAKCVLCKSNKLISEVEVLEESVVASMECLADKNYTIMRRAEKYFKCSSCPEGSVKSFTYPDRKIIELETVNNEEGLLLVPRQAGSVPAVENRIGNERGRKTILFPTGIDAVKVAPNVSAKTMKDIQLLIYGDQMLQETELSLLYQNQLSKYQSVRCAGDFYFGKVKNDENKTLTSVKKHTSDGYIKGSDRWLEIQEDNLSTMFREFGRMAIKFEVELSTNSNDVLATTIMQQGIAVSINFEGDATQEQSALYFVHTGHSAAENCGQNCRKVKLQEYMQTFEGESAPSTFIACIHQKLEALKSLVQCPSSILRSKEFHFNIHFTQTGMAIIRGVVWPTFFEELNYLRLLHGVNSAEVLGLEQEMIEKIDKALSTSTDKVVIQEQFEISENAAETLLTFVQENQIHIEDDSVQSSDNLPLPSLKTLLKKVPEIEENIRTSLRFRKKMQKCLQEVSAYDKRILTTEEYLQKVWDNHLDSSHLIDRRIWRIIIDGEEFNFHMEPRLRALNAEFGDNIGGAYHFALGCVSASESFSVVLRRLRLVECYTDSYSPIFLKAFASPISMEPLNGMGSVDWKLNQETMGESTVNIEGHKEISIVEAVSLMDTRKNRLCSSRSTEFVFSVQNKHIYLKKVPENNDQCYKIDGFENIFYEKQNNMITRYFMRINGQEMMLSEFATNYDYVGQTQSEELYKIYHDKLDSIKESPSDKSVIGKCFPDIIICSNKDIMKRRKNFKILTYPNLMEENDVKYSKTLLYYYPLKSVEDLTTSLDDLYSMPADDGSQRTVVSKNERMFLLKRRKQGEESV